MSGIHDMILGRVTNDLDIAVFVENADQYEILKTELINTGRFFALKSSRYTLLFDGHTQINIACPANTGAQRLALTNEPLDPDYSIKLSTSCNPESGE